MTDIAPECLIALDTARVQQLRPEDVPTEVQQGMLGAREIMRMQSHYFDDRDYVLFRHTEPTPVDDTPKGFGEWIVATATYHVREHGAIWRDLRALMIARREVRAAVRRDRDYHVVKWTAGDAVGHPDALMLTTALASDPHPYLQQDPAIHDGSVPGSQGDLQQDPLPLITKPMNRSARTQPQNSTVTSRRSLRLIQAVVFHLEQVTSWQEGFPSVPTALVVAST
ncbi:Uu.00g038100.m01.CDS01 [Anthostomella pinea]|uniref:Uu.00g038100.m01.CDS01 n=1 Tax=Anthostomella pinea TaxID=933095 RepID=A0AAI8YDQ6_9PEZI|nr:Uu.00g038100.m01.CDS01 [Anthostomella pinea]